MLIAISALKLAGQVARAIALDTRAEPLYFRRAFFPSSSFAPNGRGEILYPRRKEEHA